MRFGACLILLAIILVMCGMAHAQTMVLACGSPWGVSENCQGCSDIHWSTPSANVYVKSASQAQWWKLGALAADATVDIAMGKADGAAASCAEVTGTATAASLLGVTTPPLTGAVTITVSPPTKNDDGSSLTDLASERLEVGHCGAGNTFADHITDYTYTPPQFTQTLTGWAVGTYCVRAFAKNSAGAESVSTNVLPVTVAASVPTCGPAPATQTRAQTCPAPLVGSFQQTFTSTAAAAPTCWTSAWLPTDPPAGMCAAPSPLVTAGPLSYFTSGTAAAPVMTSVGYVAAGLPCGPDVKTVSGVKFCRIVKSQTDLIGWPVPLAATDLWARAQ